MTGIGPALLAGLMPLTIKMQLRKIFKSKKAHSSSTHIAIGFAVLFVLYLLNQNYKWVDVTALSYLQIIFIGFITWIYSQMPDMDLPNSKISRYATMLGIGLIIYSLIQGDKILGVFRLVQHRTVIHSLIAGIIISLPLYLFNPVYGIIALIMFLAHIISENEFSIWAEKDWRVFK